MIKAKLKLGNYHEFVVDVNIDGYLKIDELAHEYCANFYYNDVKLGDDLMWILYEKYGEEIEEQINKICEEDWEAKYYDSARENYANRI